LEKPSHTEIRFPDGPDSQKQGFLQGLSDKPTAKWKRRQKDMGRRMLEQFSRKRKALWATEGEDP